MISYDNKHRQKHFDFFNAMAQPHFNVTANVDITRLMITLKKNNLLFTPTIVYLIAKTANSIPQFRHRIRKNQVIEHAIVHPSFAVYTEVADVFSFCEVKYIDHFQDFTQRAKIQIDAMRTNPVFEDEVGRDDYLFLSSLPWVHFTGLTHAMHTPAQDSVPRITWGKYIDINQQILLPLSVQVHHAVVDGRQVGQFYEYFQSLADQLTL